MPNQMIAELEIKCDAQAVAGRLHEILTPKGSNDGTFELEVPFQSLGLPPIGKLARQATVSLGERELRSDGATLVPVRWQDAESHAFPEFKGYFEILPMATNLSQVAIIGDYVPPLGAVGAAFDAAVGKHIAEATVRTLLERLRAALEG